MWLEHDEEANAITLTAECDEEREKLAKFVERGMNESKKPGFPRISAIGACMSWLTVRWDARGQKSRSGTTEVPP